jgi:TRAP-type mannitol/chloroaromatic compound transport system permease small subunit
VHQFLLFIDRLSMWTGKTFAWCIIILTFGVSYEVFVRYVLRAPTTWSYDISYMMYGALFLMAGAYTVSRNGHVRGDFLYRLWPPRVQATIDMILFLIFYLPGVCALIYAGVHFSRMSWRFGEVSVFSPANIPIFPMKTLIPIAGVLLLLQGLSEILRCIECIRAGEWPARLQDGEEMETAILHHQEDEERLHPGQATSGREGDHR